MEKHEEVQTGVNYHLKQMCLHEIHIKLLNQLIDRYSCHY